MDIKLVALLLLAAGAVCLATESAPNNPTTALTLESKKVDQQPEKLALVAGEEEGDAGDEEEDEEDKDEDEGEEEDDDDECLEGDQCQERGSPPTVANLNATAPASQLNSSTAVSRAVSWFARMLTRPQANGARLVQARQSQTGNEVALAKGGQSQPRDLGMLALKALILGPLIGLTLGKALLRGLIWALVAYALHLFFPGLLSLLGLGTGLVGFARQMRPDYAQMVVHTLINLHDEFHRLPPSQDAQVVSSF